MGTAMQSKWRSSISSTGALRRDGGAQASADFTDERFWMTARCIIGTLPGDIILSSVGAVRKCGEKAGADCRERKLFSERGKAFRRSFIRTDVGKEGGTWSSIPFRG